MRVLVRTVKEDIDSASSGGAKVLPLPTIGVLFGTHNWASCNLVLDELVACGLASKSGDGSENEVVQFGDAVTERITLGQLYGVFPFIRAFHVLMYPSVVALRYWKRHE